MHILIVDDDRDFSQTLKKTLAEFGEISIAENLKIAEKKIKTETFDLIVLDYFLPDGPGLDLVKNHKQELKKTKTILMSGAASKEIAIESVNQQISAILEKPFLGSDMKKTIKTLFASKDTVLNERDNQVRIQNHEFSLTPIEFKIFKLLFDNTNLRLTRKTICEKIWGNLEISDNSFDTHLGNIKKKMANHSDILTNIKGIGYNLKA